MRGTVTKLDRSAERGVLQDNNGELWTFRRSDMEWWFDFPDLVVGDTLDFQVRVTAAQRIAFNVRRIDSGAAT
jgi:hypothetical protein